VSTKPLSAVTGKRLFLFKAEKTVKEIKKSGYADAGPP